MPLENDGPWEPDVMPPTADGVAIHIIQAPDDEAEPEKAYPS